jgi:hypothetical protein
MWLGIAKILFGWKDEMWLGIAKILFGWRDVMLLGRWGPPIVSFLLLGRRMEKNGAEAGRRREQGEVTGDQGDVPELRHAHRGHHRRRGRPLPWHLMALLTPA